MQRKSMILLSQVFVLMFSLSALAQDQTPQVAGADSARNAIRVFIDCRTCDMNFIREEMPYLNFVRDVKEAQIYLLVTSESTGSGGSNYTLFYSGYEEFANIKDTLTYTSGPDDTQDVRREGLTSSISLGLVGYLLKTPVKDNLRLRYVAPSGGRAPVLLEAEDKWRNWVFELQTQPRFSLEKSLESFSISNGVEANRVTEDWKIQNRFNQSYSNNVYFRDRVINDTLVTTRTEAVRSNWNFNHLTVRSISNHWSVGARAGASSSTFNNIQMQISFRPAIEYNFFPYTESTRRQLRAQYSIGYKYNNYNDTTIYNKIEENLFEQSFDIAYQVQQRWGSVNISFDASNYLHDFEKYAIELSGSIRLRVFKGLSLNISGGMEFIHDQIELVRGEVDDQDLYLRLRALETGYRYDGSVGITYTFGSIYNNVVNPRFGR